MNPTVSVIIPVYNAESLIQNSLKSVLDQTFQDFEIICVDDGSTDNSIKMIQQIADDDPRIHIYFQTNQGAGAARNHGFRRSRGKYVYFFDSDDICEPNLLEKTVEKLEKTDADIVCFNFVKLFPDGDELPQKGYSIENLDGKEIINYKDIPNGILTVLRPVPWNKVYKASLIRNNKLKFDEISSTNDITFSAVSAAAADKIAFLPDQLMKYCIRETGSITKTKVKNIWNVVKAVESAVSQIKQLEYYPEIIYSLQRFCASNFTYSLLHYTDDFHSVNTEEFYNYVHNFYQSDLFENPDENLSREEGRWFRIVKKYDFENFYKYYSRKIVVSMTTYPARITGVSKILDTIYNQTRKPDEVVLWLADSQFPDHEEDLPEDLKQLISEQKLSVYFCDDIKPHKKYFYAFKKFEKDLIITIDDDLLYHPDSIDSLFLSYLEFPDAVSTLRAHLILFDDNKEFLPYRDWMMETNICRNKPCMQLLATGGAGAIYAPELFDKTFLDEKAIKSLCLNADDLWLKAMEIVSGVPVVLAKDCRPLKYLPGSQENALYKSNINENKNDVQWEAIQKYINQNYEDNIIKRRIFEDPNTYYNLSGMLKIIQYQKDLFSREKSKLQDRLNKSFQENSRINGKLQQAFKDKDKFKADYTQVKTDFNKAQEELKKVKTDFSKAQDELKKVKTDFNKAQNELKKVRNDLHETKKRCENLEQYKQELLDSTAFKIGSVITYIPGTLKRKIKK